MLEIAALLFFTRLQKSFPEHVLEMAKEQESRHFQMSNSISMKLSIANISGGSSWRCRLAPAQVRADTLPAARGLRMRRRNQPIAPAATNVRSAGTPASFTRPNRISRTIATRNARTGLSTVAAAIDQMAQMGRLFTALLRADSDFGYLAPRRSIPRPALILARWLHRPVRRASGQIAVDP